MREGIVSSFQEKRKKLKKEVERGERGKGSRGAIPVVFLSDVDGSEEALKGEQDVRFIDGGEVASEEDQSLNAVVSLVQEAHHALGLEGLLFGRERRRPGGQQSPLLLLLSAVAAATRRTHRHRPAPLHRIR